MATGTMRLSRGGLVLLGAAAAATAVLLALLFGGLRDRDEATGESPVPVLLRAVQSVERSPYVAVSGETEAWRTVQVAFQTGGVVSRVGPDVGDRVTGGGALAALETSEHELRLELALAAAEGARGEMDRALQLQEREGISAADFARVRTAFRQAEAQRELAEKALADTQLTAPLSAIVARRGLEVGEPVAPGVPVFTLVDLDSVQIRVGVPESDVGRITVGQFATIALPSRPGASFEGRVRQVGVTADPISRTYPIRITLPNPELLLRPGMIAQVRIQGSGSVHTVSVPGDAIVRDPQGASLLYVYLPEEERVYARRVEVGTLRGTEVEVTSGLTAGEFVVIGGQHRVREGSAVRAVFEGDPDAGDPLDLADLGAS